MNEKQDENYLEKDSEQTLDAMFKSGDAFRFVSEFASSKAYEVTADGETKKYIEFDASSDQEDLAGDVMLLSALQEMESSAPGTIMLRDHNRSTDMVFGWITEAQLVKENGMQILRLKAEVDDEDKSNVRIWKSISKGRKLGASVTVIVLEKDAHPSRKKSLIIKSVKLLEVSIVTIPCNQQSWTLAATASKALQISQAIAQKAAELIEDSEENPAVIVSIPAIKSKKVEEIMSNKNQAAVIGTDDKTILTRTLAAKLAHETRVEKATATKTAPEVLDVVTKGLFADEQAKRQPTLWDLFDILCSVKWQLMDRKWAIDYANAWSESPIADDYDYLSEYKTACEEFAGAAVKSFAYYGGWTMPGDETSLDDSTVIEDDMVDDEMLSNALDIEKSFADFVGTLKKSPEQMRASMAEIGSQFVEVAKAAGIPLGIAPAENAEAELTEEVVRKSAIFIDTETRAKNAEDRVEELETEMEIAKAGLNQASEAIEQITRQPLHLGKN